MTMAGLNFLILVLCAISAIASPRNLPQRNQKRNSGSGGGSDPPGYSHGDPGLPTSDYWSGPSQYGGSWGHSSTSDVPSPPYDGGDGGLGHSSTCAASTVTQTVAGPASTVYISGSGYTSILPASTVYISGSGYTSIVPASTVYISGSDHTSTVPASTVYVSGSDHTSFVPASTVTVAGPAQTSVLTAFKTLTQPAALTTVYVTRIGQGWNHTITQEEMDVVTTTEHDYSTIYNEETTTLTSVVTLPGEATTKLAGGQTTFTEYETTTLAGGSFTLTEFATKTLPGSTITSIIDQPGENSTITSTETTTYYETISTCNATPIGPVSSPQATTIYATNYVTKLVPKTAQATCSDSTITVTASSGDWDKPDGYGPHSSSSGDWGDKPDGYGGAAAPTSTGSWKRA